MSEVTSSEIPAAPLARVVGNARERLITYAVAAAYALLTSLAVLHHEPWADEAQAWLLARDSNLVKLWGTLLHYEGTPGLWPTLLHALIRLGLPYSTYGFVSAGLGFLAVLVILKYAPFPLYIRALLPFTYYLCYQYAVIARSYSLIAPILFTIAAIYPKATSKPVVITMLLALLAAVSAHGLLISACIWAVLFGPELLSAPAPQRKKLIIASLAYWAVLLLLVLSAWPASNVAFAEHRGLANWQAIGEITKTELAGGFTGSWIASLLLIVLSLPSLVRGGGWIFFLLATGAICLFGTIIYAQLWHFGILFLVWIFALWISAYRARLTPVTILALIATIGVQCYWSGSAITYDWNHPYSGSVAAARYLKQTNLPPGGLYAIGYSTTAVQPYFPANIYSDFAAGYWDWSKRNTANDPAALIASQHRQFVLVGYTDTQRQQSWSDLLGLLGYRLERRFDGTTFWQTKTGELESFDLYTETSTPHAASTIFMGDPAKGAQLLTGFYGIEAGKWRWSAKNFSVLLKAPPGSQRNGAELALQLSIPDSQLQRLGPITLTADVGGRALPPHTYTTSDASVYSAHVPAQALQSGFAVINFQLDKAAVVAGDARELGVIITGVSLDPGR